MASSPLQEILRHMPRTVRVGALAGGDTEFVSLQAAIDYANAQAPAAASPWTVVVYPGVYTGPFTFRQYVNVLCLDPASCILTIADATLALLASNMRVSNATFRLTAPSAGRNMVTDNGAITDAWLSGCRFEITVPGAFASNLLAAVAASTINLERCYGYLTGAGCASACVTNANDGAVINLYDCNLGTDSAVVPIGAIQNVFQGTINVRGGAIFGTAPAFYSVGAGRIIIEGCAYKGVNRSGVNGTIMDISPEPKRNSFRLLSKPWGSLDNIAARVAVGGSLTLGGSGQAVLRVNDNAADVAGDESPADAAGSLDSSFTPLRGPRYVQPVSISALRATATMFFGLRAALGNAVPGMAEDHAGFIWNGANWIASSSDGGGVGQTTVLANPATGQHITLEVRLYGNGAGAPVRVEFYQDGYLVATHTNAAGCPNTAVDWQEIVVSSGAGGATTSDVTLREGFLQECPA